MKQIQNFLLLITLLSITAVACHKDDHHHDDTANPVLVITAPTANASIGGAVTIAGKVTDGSLHEMSIIVTKDSDNAVLFTATPTVHDLTSYTIAEIWTPVGITAETAVTLTIVAEDHNSNATTATVKFTVKP